ncbi:MAG: GHKL domain-containing protein [Balneolaceae bacterium]|nr:MAG: GHKL domain-containing protein [Balneolaceae bacterium]
MSKSIPKELQEVYDRVWRYFFHEVPISEMNLEQVFADEFMGYGTTREEIINNLNELYQLLQAQAKQGENFEIETKRSNIHQHLSEDGRTGVFAEEIFLSIKDGDDIHKIEFRSSLVFELINNAWKLVHLHSSIPSDTENDYFHVNEWKAEKEKLEKLVAEQTSDLQQKNRELEMEAATERVRAVAMGMQKPEDIMKVLDIIKREVERFELENIGTWFWIFNDDHTLTQWDISEVDPNGIIGGINITIDLDKAKSFRKHDQKMYGKEYYTMLWKGAELQNVVDDVKEVDPVSGQKFQEAVDSGFLDPYWQACAPFSRGVLGLDYSFEPPKAAHPILTKMASAFDMAYQRFEDLQEAEKQTLMIREERDRLEIALEKLKATQDQLVQQEKLASLGQLTAGIAHEIKNPLNFVNNFSEVSLEMVEEAREEVKEKLTADSRQLTAILDDIEANLRKIHEHGSRADSIVKSMLQHSRGGDGKMEPTPLNPLVKEYVNLAFHGMRAGKDPITVDIQLALDDSIGEVPLIGEDFSRVIVNLCNNAFDAMREKMTGDGGPKTGKTYSPKLTIRTKSENGQILIEVQDNGPGIPDEIKDKILQPFFTTKKGTQGTGLGLSITNEIVKAHGGKIEITSVPGEGSTFTIQLPKQGL